MPPFAPGTELVVTAIFEGFPLRRQAMATAAWKCEELNTIRLLINTVLVSLPDVAIAADLGKIRVEVYLADLNYWGFQQATRDVRSQIARNLPHGSS
jgi:DNA mismatch repair ATPase MutL